MPKAVCCDSLMPPFLTVEKALPRKSIEFGSPIPFTTRLLFKGGPLLFEINYWMANLLLDSVTRDSLVPMWVLALCFVSQLKLMKPRKSLSSWCIPLMLFLIVMPRTGRGDGRLNEPALVNSFLNSITLQVRVPVLSEKMYSIWPSSSLIFVVYAFMKKSC